MSAHLGRKLEKTEQILEYLIQESADGVPILVEGDNDAQTLRHLGIQGKIVCAKTGGKSILDLIGQIEENRIKEVILLFDFDRGGKNLTKIFMESLRRVRVRTDLTFWNQLLAIVGREVKDIEGLDAYLDTLRTKAGKIPLGRI